MDQNVLQLWRGGQVIFRVASTSTGVQVEVLDGKPREGPRTFDRLELFNAPAASTRNSGKPSPRVIVDAVPALDPDRIDTSNESSLTATFTNGALGFLSLRCVIRCYIAGKHPASVIMAGALEPAQVTSGGSSVPVPWLSFQARTFQLGTTTVAGQLALADVPSQWGWVNGEFAPVLTEALGLSLKPTSGMPATVRFVNPTKPLAPTASTIETDTSVSVVRFERRLVLEPADQGIRMGGLTIDVSCAQVRALRLDREASDDDAPGSSIPLAKRTGSPGALVQTHLLYDDDQVIAPQKPNRYAVTIQGLPSAGVLSAWNRSIVRPYIDALQTVEAGRAISSLPRLAPLTSDDGRDCGCETAPLPQPGTILPQGDVTLLADAIVPWRLVLELSEPHPERPWLTVDDFDLGLADAVPPARGCDSSCVDRDHPLRLRFRARDRDRIAVKVRSVHPMPNLPPKLPQRQGSSSGVIGIEAHAAFEALRDHSANPVKARCWILPAVNRAEWPAPNGIGGGTGPPPLVKEIIQGEIEAHYRGFVFNFQQRFPVPPPQSPSSTPPPFDTPQTARFGALDLTFGGDFQSIESKEDGSLGLGNRDSTVTAALRPDNWGRTGIPTLDVSIGLRVEVLAPGGQDALPNDPFNRINVPFDTLRQVETGQVPPSLGSSSSMHCEESLPEIQARFIREPAVVIVAEEPPLEQPAVLSIKETTNPFQSQLLVMKLYQWQGTDSALQSFGQPATISKPLQRLIVLDRHPFLVAQVVVPPFQGLPGPDGTPEIANWSIANLEGPAWEITGVSDGFPLTLSPQTLGEAMEKDTAKPGIDVDKPIDFRLSIPARFDLLSSYFKQNYAEAPWNLRRVLGFPGQKAPGAGVQELRFELLYGLLCDVTAPQLRLAELSARLGNVPGPLAMGPFQFVRDDFPAPDAIKEWTGALKDARCAWSWLYRAYLSRLCVLEPWDADQTGTLTLRQSAEGGRPPEVTYFLRSLEVAPQANPVQSKRELTDPRLPGGDPGLPGGVLWGVEFDSLYNLLRNPVNRKSSSGELSRPYFSTLGGWGYQKACFDNDRQTICSDTAMGRVFFYSLERIGRVGGFWNVAKHVIIYERSVVPSLQFVGDQDPLPGRPLLRKVREFIEILQPRRMYPEFGAAPMSRGCVAGCEFKRTIIPVNSKWGEDVNDGLGNVGYKIPLWRHGEDPAVYPKPQVILHLVPDPATGADTTACELDEPDKLVFYSDTTPNGDRRTDLWHPVAWVDYPDLPPIVPPTGDGFDSNDMDRTLPDAPAVEAGHDRFTYAVIAGTRTVNLVAGRTDKSLNALIRNVTMSRAKPPETQPSEKRKNAQAALSRTFGLDSALQQLATKLAPPIPQGTDFATVKTAFAKNAGDTIDNWIKSLQTQAAGKYDVVTALGGLGLKTSDLCDQLTNAARTQVQNWVNRAQGFLNDLESQLNAEIRAATKTGDGLKAVANSLIDQGRQQFETSAGKAKSGLESVRQRVDQAAAVLDQLAGLVQSDVSLFLQIRDAYLPRVGPEPVSAEIRQRLTDALAEARRRILAQVCPAFARAGSAVQSVLSADLGQALAKLSRDLVSKVNGTDIPELSKADATTKQVSDAIDAWAAAMAKAVDDQVAAARAALKNVVDPIDAQLKNVTGSLDAWPDTLQKSLKDAVSNAAGTVDALSQAISAVVQSTRNDLNNQLQAFADKASGAVSQLCKANLLLSGIDPATLASSLDGLKASVLNEINNATNFDGLKKGIEDTVGAVRSDVSRFADQAVSQISKIIPASAVDFSDRTLQLVRSFGDAPIVQGLGFNRERMAYYYDQAKNILSTTPVTGLLNRVGGELKSLGSRVPTNQLLDRVLPNPLDNFDLSKILPDFAGLKLSNLLPDLKMPPGAKDAVKVTQGIDQQSLRGWVQADINLGSDKTTDLFNAGPVKVSVRRPLFVAAVRIEAGVNGPPKRKANGKITADWVMSLGGQDLVSFVTTDLTFDDSGKIKFNLSPDRVRLSGLLQLLSDTIAKAGDPDSGFSIHLLEHDGMPVGAEAVLELPLPDLSFGTFSISNLVFGAALSLEAFPEFALAVRVHLGKNTAPFVIIVFILGGGGWFTAGARYLPFSRRVVASVSIGVSAGAMLALAFGPVKGSIYAFFSIEAEFETGGEGGDTLHIAIMLLIGGEVSAFGLITVSIQLLLELEYQNTGALIGRGTLSVRVKLFLITLSASVSVEYKFTKGKGLDADHRAVPPVRVLTPSFARLPFDRLPRICGGAPGDPYDDAAKLYLSMLD